MAIKRTLPIKFGPLTLGRIKPTKSEIKKIQRGEKITRTVSGIKVTFQGIKAKVKTSTGKRKEFI